MKIILWIGNEGNQKALANKIHARFPLTAIITETRKHKRKITGRKIVEKVIEKIFLRAIGKAWWGMLDYYNSKFPSFPNVPILDVENINSAEAFEFSSGFAPDLVIVSGTRLVKKKLLSIKPGTGILNLHTGLSPYIKGGPNCTNWCIALEQFHLIGNTIMWIDEGIDTGNIMATEFTTFNGDEGLQELHIKVMEHAHDLFVRSIEQVNAGNINNVPQSQIAKGNTYYTKQWGLKEKMQLVRHLKKFRRAVKSGEIEKKKIGIVVVPISNSVHS